VRQDKRTVGGDVGAIIMTCIWNECALVGILHILRAQYPGTGPQYSPLGSSLFHPFSAEVPLKAGRSAPTTLRRPAARGTTKARRRPVPVNSCFPRKRHPLPLFGRNLGSTQCSESHLRSAPALLIYAKRDFKAFEATRFPLVRWDGDSLHLEHTSRDQSVGRCVANASHACTAGVLMPCHAVIIACSRGEQRIEKLMIV
jgi:hypothetical protein